MRLLLSFLVFLVIPVSDTGYAGEGDACNGVELEGWYYLVDLDDVATISTFFRKIPDTFFVDLEGFTISAGNRKLRDTFYDHESEDILRAGKELFFRENLYLPRYRDDREQIIFVDRNNGAYRHYYKVKKYRKNLSPLDKHPLLGRVRRKDRADLQQRLRDGDTSEFMLDLKAQLVVEHRERLYIFTHLGEEYGSIVLDHVSMRIFGLDHSTVVFRFVLNPTVSSAQDKQTLNEYFCRVKRALEQRLGRTQKGTVIGYQEFHAMADSKLPNRQWLMKHPMVYMLGQVLILVVIGFLVLFILVRRIPERTTYRVVSRKDGGNGD